MALSGLWQSLFARNPGKAQEVDGLFPKIRLAVGEPVAAGRGDARAPARDRAGAARRVAVSVERNRSRAQMSANADHGNPRVRPCSNASAACCSHSGRAAARHVLVDRAPHEGGVRGAPVRVLEARSGSRPADPLSALLLDRRGARGEAHARPRPAPAVARRALVPIARAAVAVRRARPAGAARRARTATGRTR